MSDKNTGGKFGKWLRENPRIETKIKEASKKGETVAEMLARCKAQEEKDKKERRRT